MKLSAVIFDLDGTIIDSREEWNKAFLEVLKSLGKVTSDAGSVEHGFPIEDNWRHLLTKYQIKTEKTLPELRDLTYRAYAKFLPEIRLKPGVVDLLDRLKDGGVKIALATNSEWSVVDRILVNLGLEGVFDATVTEEEILNKKPAPDALLIAADKLGFPVEDCLAVGDTLSDIEAAKDAGMKVIIILSDAKDAVSLKKADLLVENYSEITPQAIAEL